jgi:RNA polymerase sigma factor (sigma-70 family)
MNHLQQHLRPGPRRARHAPGRVPSTFSTIYRTHYDFVWRCALRLGGDEALADDLVQDTFLVALRRLPKFEPDGAASLSTWLFGILRNTLRNHARGERRREQRHARLQQHDDQEHDADAAALHVALGSLQRFLDELDDERRAVFVLAELEGHSSSEIAEALGINASTARSRLRAARRSFDETFAAPELAVPVRVAIRSARERPPAGDPERRRASYQVIMAAAAGQLAPVAAPVGALSLGWWLAGAGSVLVLVGLVGLAVSDGRVRASATASTATATSDLAAVGDEQDTSASVVASLDVQEAADPILVIPSAPERSAAHRDPEGTAPPPEQPDRPDREVEQLRVLADARAALLEGEPARALAQLGEVEAWATVALDARAIGLELGALCALGRSGEAQQRSADWMLAHPDRPLDSRASSLCW